MSGATLRVEYKLADSCRANSCVSKLILDSKASFIDARQVFADRHLNPTHCREWDFGSFLHGL
jgi:hypothetical protein